MTCTFPPTLTRCRYALRTEPGSTRQQVHFDTPHQKKPPLYAAFISLQDVTPSMGPTIFLPGSHTRNDKVRRILDDFATLAWASARAFLLGCDIPTRPPLVPRAATWQVRRMWDDGIYNGDRDKALQSCDSRYALLGTGDLVLFDMRALHAGMQSPRISPFHGRQLWPSLSVLFGCGTSMQAPQTSRMGGRHESSCALRSETLRQLATALAPSTSAMCRAADRATRRSLRSARCDASWRVTHLL